MFMYNRYSRRCYTMTLAGGSRRMNANSLTTYRAHEYPI